MTETAVSVTSTRADVVNQIKANVPVAHKPFNYYLYPNTGTLYTQLTVSKQ